MGDINTITIEGQEIVVHEVVRTHKPDAARMVVTKMEGRVILEGGPDELELGDELEDGAVIQVAKGASCVVSLVRQKSEKSLLRIVGESENHPQPKVLVTSHFPECIHLDRNCCDSALRYEVLTPAGTIKVSSVFASPP